MRAFPHGLALLTVILLPVRASAGEPEGKAQETSQQRVHVGSASVTVVDEHEAVDDVITRIRTGKSEPASDKEPGKQPQSGQPAVASSTANVNKDSGRATLKVVRERTTASTDVERRKDERRERAATARAHTEQKRR
jgi:hypothetical protein